MCIREAFVTMITFVISLNRRAEGGRPITINRGIPCLGKSGSLAVASESSARYRVPDRGRNVCRPDVKRSTGTARRQRRAVVAWRKSARQG